MRSFIVTAIVFFSYLSLSSQIVEPIKWSFSQSPGTDDDVLELFFEATIDKGWHLYSTDLPEGGPIKTTFHFEPLDSYELLGGMKPLSEPSYQIDPSFNMELGWYSNKAKFLQRIRLKTAGPISIKGYVEFMSCNDETCMPPSEVDFLFEAGDEVSSFKGEGLFLFFILSLLAGLAAILTPCVYPMIPMTVSFFMNSGKSRTSAKIQAFSFGTFIILIYTFIGVLVSAVFGADVIRDVSNHWVSNLIFFLLFFVFALSFFGAFEIVLPSGLTSKTDRQADKGGFMGAFFMALTLVLVSFSCTAPFVGSILVEAATGVFLKPMVGMFGFSSAFAIVFTILALFPSWLNKLPKSGGWLNSVKVILAFLILMIGSKYLLVPNAILGWGIKREVFLSVWIVLSVLMGVYLLGKIRFPHDSETDRVTILRFFLAVTSFSFAVYLIPGLFGAPLKSLSGYLPSERSWSISGVARGEAGFDNTSVSVLQPGLMEVCEAPKYADKFSLPDGLKGYFDLEQGMSCAKEANMPVFVEFKGHACTNCKVMEGRVLSEPAILKKLRDNFVVIALYVDDRTKLPESEWVTSSFDGKVKDSIGKKNADYQVSRFKSNTQPFFVLMDADGKLLTTPRGFSLDVSDFEEFLDVGIEQFKQHSSRH